MSTTVNALVVPSPVNAQYTFTGFNGAVLTTTLRAEFTNDDFQALKLHTLSILGLNTPLVRILDDAILSLNSLIVTTDASASAQLRSH
jgi:hypothetical protein